MNFVLYIMWKEKKIVTLHPILPFKAKSIVCGLWKAERVTHY